MKKGLVLEGVVKQRTGRPLKRGKPYPYIRLPSGKYVRCVPYRELKTEKVCRLVKALKPNEFLWWKGGMQYVQKNRIRAGCNADIHQWSQGEETGFLIFRKGQIGEMLDGSLSLGEKGRVQKIFGLPDFSQAVPE